MLHRIAPTLKRSWRGITGMALAAAIVATTAAPALADTTTGNIQGTVTSAGQPVAAVNVIVAAPSGRYTATTDAKGFYSLVGVVPDTYTVAFSKAGYGEATVNGVAVSAMRTSTVNQTITPELRQIGSTTSPTRV